MGVSVTLFLIGCSAGKDQSSDAPPSAQREPSPSDRSLLDKMAAAVSELKSSPSSGKARDNVGELWIQASRLKGQRQDTRSVEGLLSDLEGNLRSSQPDVGARKHIINELEYEIEALKRRNR